MYLRGRARLSLKKTSSSFPATESVNCGRLVATYRPGRLLPTLPARSFRLRRQGARAFYSYSLVGMLQSPTAKYERGTICAACFTTGTIILTTCLLASPPRTACHDVAGAQGRLPKIKLLLRNAKKEPQNGASYLKPHPPMTMAKPDPQTLETFPPARSPRVQES